jgi:multidrug resistance efflux pump
VRQRDIILGGAALVFAVLVGTIVFRSLSGPPANRLVVAGNVRAVTRVVTAPAISNPNADYSVSVPSDAAMGEKVAKLERITPRSTGAQSSMGQPVVSGRLARVYVAAGDHVRVGQTIAQFDTSLLNLGIEQAKANAARTKANVRVLKANLKDIAENEDDVAEGFDQLASGKSQLASGKSQLLKARSQLRSARSQLLELKRDRSKYRAALAALKKQAAMFPPGHVPAQITKNIAKLTKLLASIDPGLAKVNAGLAKVEDGLAKLADAKSKLASAADKLNTAEDALADAKKQVKRVRDSLEIIADAQQILIDLAVAKRAQATITSPVAGTVTYAAAQGTIAMVGAPIARIAPDESALVDTYLTGEQLGRVRAGGVADIAYDSAPGEALRGTLALVGDRAVFPPTGFPTEIVHMTRAVKVTFRLDPGDYPPQGTPVDVSIHLD